MTSVPRHSNERSSNHTFPFAFPSVPSKHDTVTQSFAPVSKSQLTKVQSCVPVKSGNCTSTPCKRNPAPPCGSATTFSHLIHPLKRYFDHGLRFTRLFQYPLAKPSA